MTRNNGSAGLVLVTTAFKNQPTFGTKNPQKRHIVIPDWETHIVTETQPLITRDCPKTYDGWPQKTAVTKYGMR